MVNKVKRIYFRMTKEEKNHDVSNIVNSEGIDVGLKVEDLMSANGTLPLLAGIKKRSKATSVVLWLLMLAATVGVFVWVKMMQMA